jgi:cell division septation protein DedD
MRNQRIRRIPKSLSFSQVVTRVLIAGVVILLLIFIAILVNHRYLCTHSNGPVEIVSSAHPKLQTQPKSEPSPAPSAPPAEAKPDTPLTFYDSLVHKETPDSKNSSVPSEPKAATLSETAPKPATLSETVPKLEGKGPGEGTPGYTVQVGAFQSLDIAEGIVESLKKKGYSPSLATVSFPNGKTWHRVRIGNCNSRGEAEVLVQKIKETGNFEPMIISPEKGKEDSHKTLNNSLGSAASQPPPLPPQGLPEGVVPKP